MLQGYFLARDHFYMCDKFVHVPMEKDEVKVTVAIFRKTFVIALVPTFIDGLKFYITTQMLGMTVSRAS